MLARGIAEALGIEPREVQSPTFTLIREHRGKRGRLIHVDLYRLAPEEAAELGLEGCWPGRESRWSSGRRRLPFEVPGARCPAARRGRREARGREIVEENENNSIDR